VKKFMLVLTMVLLITSSVFAGELIVPDHPGAGSGDSMRDPISSFHFDADNEGWQSCYVGISGASYETLYPNVPALWNPTGGDPDGHIYQTVSDDRNQRAYWFGYIGANGFMGNLDGQIIQTNVYSTGNWTTISRDNGGVGGDDGNVYARWVISREVSGAYGMYISKQSVSLDMNTFAGWEAFTVDVNAGNFLRWPNSDDPSISWAEVMAEYNQIGLYIFSGTDDMTDVNGGGTTWFNDGGISRVQHYGASAVGSSATWGVDNPTVSGSTVAVEGVSFDQVKALYR
jgi:hypothetical protein